MSTPRPPKYKMATLTWIAIYPLITVILYVFGPELQAFPIFIRTLILTVVLVPLMVWVAVPFLQKIFSKWLRH